MRKVFAIVAFMFFALSASAQLRFGVKGGFNISKMSVSSEVFEAKNRVGFFLGPTVKANINALGIANVGLDASLLYDQRNAKLEATSDYYSYASPDIKRSSIIVPINARLGIGAGETVEAFVKAGPQVSFNMGDDKITWGNADEKFSASLKEKEYSVNIGAGLMLLSKLEVAANYNVVIGNSVKDFSQENYDSKVKYSWKDLKNNAWQISATWYF